MGDDKEAIKAFQLVEFDPANRTQKRGTIECVPSTWISYNPSTGRCQCKFMPPPYSVEDAELLCLLVKQQSPPPESWPVYPMTLKRHATTYNDAMKRLTVLEDKKFVYTEDGVLPEKKSEAAKKAYQRIKFKSDKVIAEQLMRVSPINTSGDRNHTLNAESSFEISDSVFLDDDSIKAKKKQRKLKNMTETESTDENSNVIYQARKKPKPKSINKQSNRIREASSTGRDRVNKTPRTLSNYTSSFFKSKSKNSTSSTIRSWHDSPAPQAASGAILARNRDREDEVETQKNCKIEAVSEKSKPSPSSQSSKSHKKIEPKLSKRSSPEVAGSTKNLPTEKSCELNQRDRDILSEVRYDVQMLTKAIDQLKGIVERSVLAKDAHGANVQSFATQYDLKLPLTTLEGFDEFDEKLKTDKKFRKEFASTLHFIIDCNNVTLPKNITALLKKHISRDAALNFNAVKVGRDKRIFKETRFRVIMLDVFLLKYREGVPGLITNITEKSFYRELGNCFSNAIDWDGHRASRSKTRTANNTAIAAAQAVRSHSNTSTELSEKSSDKFSN